MAYSPYKAAGAATNWIEDYFKLSKKQKEAITLGKEQKGKTRAKFNKEVEKVQKSMKRAQSKRKKGFFEKAFGDFAPIAMTIAGALTGNPALMAWGAGLKGGKKGYDIHQQSKHTKRRSKYSLEAINKVIPQFRGTFVQPESTLGPSKRHLTDRIEAAKKMRDPFNILVQAAVEGGKTYAMGKAVEKVGPKMFESQSVDKLGYSVDPTWAATGAAGLKTGATAFTPFKALGKDGFKSLFTGEGDDEAALAMLYILSSLQEGMDN